MSSTPRIVRALRRALGRPAAGTEAAARARGQRVFVFGYQNVLGTSLGLSIAAADERAAERARDAALAEIDRLEPIYSRFDPASELNRWLGGESERVSPDLAWLLAESDRWIALTAGAFHPGADALLALWREAETAGTPPSERALERVLASFAGPPWDLDETALRAHKRFPFGLDFNAIAKGRIVDRSALAAAAAGAREVLLDIGGDIRHLGSNRQRVAVADPRNPADNAPPGAVITLSGEAVATSGGTYRGFRVAELWYSHVLDPRTGRPVRGTAAATVIAPDCATADVLATAFNVLAPHESLALADSLTGVGCLLHTSDGDVLSNATFDRHAA